MAFQYQCKIKWPATSEYGFPNYGQEVFQGAYVYKIDLENGFNLLGKITHSDGTLYNLDHSDDEITEKIISPDVVDGSYYSYDSRIERVLYINDVLYTLSNKFIKANSLENFGEIESLELNKE